MKGHHGIIGMIIIIGILSGAPRMHGLRLQRVAPFAVPSHLSLEGTTQAELAAQAAQHNMIAWMDQGVGARVGGALISAGAQRLNEHAAGHLHHWEF